jgi:hypothetical protein
MSSTGYFHLHTADRVYRAFGCSKGHILGSGELSLLLNSNSIATQCYGMPSRIVCSGAWLKTCS